MLTEIDDNDEEKKEPAVVKEELIKDNIHVALKSLYCMHLWLIRIMCILVISWYFCVVPACMHSNSLKHEYFQGHWKFSSPLAVCGRSMTSKRL